MMLLIAMAYDRYTAIYQASPLSNYYESQNVHVLVVAAWIIGVTHVMSQFVFVINLPFCGPNNVGELFIVIFLGLLNLHA